MAVLTKEDRIALSLKIVGIEDELKDANAGLDDSEKSLIDLTKKDEPNRKLLLEKTENIKPYQDELLLFDGNLRTELTETIMEDAVNRVLNNSFYPNDLSSPLPSVPDGIWKFFVPFLGNHGIGKTALEVFVSTGGRGEQQIIADINAQIAILESFVVARRISGQECVPGVPAFCSGEPGGAPFSGNQMDCEGPENGGPGIWTPATFDHYIPDPTLTVLKNLVQEWEDTMNAGVALHPSFEKNATRIAGNIAAAADVTAAIVVIDAWQLVQDHDTITGLPGSCAAFDALVEGNFQQAKLSPTTLAPLKAEIIARSAYVVLRSAELSGANYLGSVTQNLSSGSITGFTGLYGERGLLIDLRINALSGSLTGKMGVATTKEIQEQFKESSNNAEVALSLAMTAVKAIAPGIDTKYLNVKSSSGFSVGDRVFVVANDQEELSASIEEISNNRIKLTCVIPKKYTTNNKTRLYKVL